MSTRELRQNGDHDREPDTDPLSRTVHDEAVALRDDALLRRLDGQDTKLDALIDDVRGISGRLTAVEGHSRGHVDALRVLFENVGQVAVDAQESKAEILEAVSAVSRQLEQKRIEGAAIGRSSSPHIVDVQALGQQIESSHQQHAGTIEVMKHELATLKKHVGAEANENLGVKGYGLLGTVQTFSRRRELVLYALGASGLVSTLATLLPRLFGGH